ncbi:unnamed protein product [Mortierella alpina]
MSYLTAVKIFDIPELTSLVAKHLGKPDLVACARVSCAWHNTFIPFIYRSVKIARYHRQIRDRASWDGFQKHSSHMRELAIEHMAECDFPLFGFNCTNLTVLRLTPPYEASSKAQWSSGLLKLISNNLGISTLRLLMSDDPVVDDIEHHLVVLGLLRYMSELKKLVIIGPSMGETSVDESMRCAYRLEELDVKMDRIKIFPSRSMMRMWSLLMGCTFWILKVDGAGKGSV